MNDLEKELRYAVEDAILGEPLRPGLAHSAKSAAMAVLHRHNVRGAQVQVRQQGNGFSVVIALPRGPQKVQQIVLNVGSM